MRTRQNGILLSFLALLSWGIHPAIHPHLFDADCVSGCHQASHDSHSHTGSDCHSSHSHEESPAPACPSGEGHQVGCEVCASAVEFHPDMAHTARLLRGIEQAGNERPHPVENEVVYESIDLPSVSRRGPPVPLSS